MYKHTDTEFILKNFWKNIPKLCTQITKICFWSIFSIFCIQIYLGIHIIKHFHVIVLNSTSYVFRVKVLKSESEFLKYKSRNYYHLTLLLKLEFHSYSEFRIMPHRLVISFVHHMQISSHNLFMISCVENSRKKTIIKNKLTWFLCFNCTCMEPSILDSCAIRVKYK